jgi:uncharacterized protein involved in response to NO
MSTRTATLTLPPSALRVLAAAPHRLLFFIGATNVLPAMCWWAVWLADARWHWFSAAQPAIPAGWLHAFLMQYQVLPSFIFGFLLTVFPRWMRQPALSAAHYVPVAAGMLIGQLLTLAGTFAGLPLLRAGAVLTVAGWFAGAVILQRLVYRDAARDWHAGSCALALTIGIVGLTLYMLFLFGADARCMFAAIKLGSIGVLLPIYFTVCHRMIPFFAASALPGYRAAKPMWTLAAFWAFCFLHLFFEMRHGYAYLWLADVPLTLLTAGLLIHWWPKAQVMPALLRVLFLGFAWLPIAFALYSLQSFWFATTGEFILGRAPAHALFVGFFGSLLVAMVTRVTQGHSGRPLELGGVAAVAFVILQIIAVMRIAAEILPDTLLWQSLAAVGWLLAFAPWVVRSSYIYLTPRTDGKAG